MMYPSIVDMNENESSKCLRMLELDAYANVLAALRAQGPPTMDKLKLLKDVGAVLRIPQERCKAEIRKVILDERLNTIAYFSCGQLETSDEWIKEGRRLISLMPRVAPQTIYSAIADEVADAASISNEQLPLPVHTDRKRPAPTSQVQCNVPESTKSQFRIPDAFKNEESKKRKLPFGVENSTLAQHLIAPSKGSRIQQIYRQKVKATAKEEQLKTKIKQQEPEQHEFRHLHQQTRVLHQQHFQPKVQKLPLSVQTSTSASPKINILQNISIQPPNRGGEETIEQIKNEINSFVVQKPEQNRSSPQPQPGCSNENQAPKQQKQTIVNIKPTTNITYKHVSSPGPSSELQKSIKVCSRKPVTKTIPGQKLIIVSNAQSIATSSILQRTLTIPFVKNISVKNFDKFKIVSTSTSTSNLQLTTLPSGHANTFATNSAKHKVVTVRTNPTTKKMISLAHWQALNAKGSIKILPDGGKFFTKTTSTTATTPPLYIMNNVGGIQQALTKSTSSTPVIMTCRPQESLVINETKVGAPPKNEEETPSEDSANIETTESTKSTNPPINCASTSHETTKSSVLADILKASGVISSDNEPYSDDIESQITQLTAIPQTVPERIMAEETQVAEDFEIIENSEMAESQEEAEDIQNNGSTYILLGKDPDTDRLLKDLEGEDSSDVVIGNLDPGTGEYVERSDSQCNAEMESTVLNEDAYVVEVRKTSMPDIHAIN